MAAVFNAQRFAKRKRAFRTLDRRRERLGLDRNEAAETDRLVFGQNCGGPVKNGQFARTDVPVGDENSADAIPVADSVREAPVQTRWSVSRQGTDLERLGAEAGLVAEIAVCQLLGLAFEARANFSAKEANFFRRHLFYFKVSRNNFFWSRFLKRKKIPKFELSTAESSGQSARQDPTRPGRDRGRGGRGGV